MRTREQKGYVWKVGEWWWIRYADTRIENGVAVRKPGVSQKLCAVAPEHRRLKRPPEVVEEKQAEFMEKINSSRGSPERASTVREFVEQVWFPSIANRHAASTVNTYHGYWERDLSPRCGSQLLRDFSTPEAQRILEGIARDKPEMTKKTLHKLKSILSGIFKLAIQQEYRLGSNPMRETSLPRAQASAETIAYTLDEVLAMLRLVPEPSRSAIAVAAFTGLRRGEIEGLLWENYDGETLAVTRAMWQGIAGEPKTKQSKASVPVIPALRKFLDQHRLSSGNPTCGIMFVTRNSTPLSMNNLLNDQIRPALDRCACGLEKIKHGGADHDYTRDKARPEWHGFHAFRRGLATNLHALGVDDLTIQRILRHSNVSVTQQCYIKTRDAQSIAAMDKLDALVDGRVELICNESAKNAGWSRLVN
jgi:integrase